MLMRKLLLSIALVVTAWVTAMAVPAMPGFGKVTQSDGTTLTVQAVGDEWYSLLLTADDLVVDRGEDGDFYYVTTSGLSKVKAHDASSRTADELSFISANRDVMTMAAIQEADSKSGRKRSKPSLATGPKRAPIANNGAPRIPIILVNFKDRSMQSSSTVAKFQDHFMTGSGSAHQYFKDQSNGKFQPQFDVYGTFNLSGNRADYGAHGNNLNDKGRAKMVIEAAQLANSAIDWAQYDNNGDGYVDVCIVVFPGVSEAQTYGGVPDALWPCHWTLNEASYYGDGTGAFRPDNKTYINKFAVFSELGGSTDSSKRFDGIGTFCHEFSHCLGLPDFYPTGSNANSHVGMSKWSVMGTGNYNNDSETPIGYSAYEKNFMGWIDLITPEEGNQYTLPVFNQKSEATDQAVKITALNKNEYWVLENRRRQGWDAYIPAQGLLINHYTYISSRWTDNTVNSQEIQLATFVPADNDHSSSTLYDDTFGNGNYSFTSTSKPAMLANMYASGSLASTTGGAGAVDKPVTEITINSDKTVSFWYKKGTLPTLATPVLDNASDVQTTSFTASWTHNSNVNCTYSLNVTHNGTTVVEKTGITAKSYTVTGLTGGETYSFTVKAVPVDATQATASAWSASKSVTLPQNPTITVTPASVEFAGYVTRSYTQSVNVSGINLSQNITATLHDANGIYSIDKNSIASTANGVTLNITWSPIATGHTTATVVLTSAGADAVTINLSGDAQAATPTLVTNTDALTFAAAPNKIVTKNVALTGSFIAGDVKVTLNDPTGKFAIEQTTIPAGNISEDTPVNVAVSFSSAAESNFSASLTLSSAGAQSKTITLTASVSNGGKATDAYLDIVNYATIDDAGAAVDGMDRIYTYDAENDWLTVSNYGAMKADATQGWIDNSLTTSNRMSWNASDVFPASNAYFGQNSSYACDQEGKYQNFYVTNCTQVKQYVTNRTKLWTFTMNIYECTQAADGSLVADAQPVDTQVSAVYGFDTVEVLTSGELDPNKIYKVEIVNESSYMYAVAFKAGNGSSVTPVVPDPAVSATPDNVSLEAYVDETATGTITVTGEALKEDVSVALTDENNVFALDKTTISKDEAEAGAQITVTFSPQAAGNYAGTVTLTSGTATTTVALNGEALAPVHVPVITIDQESLSFNTNVGVETMQTVTVSGEWVDSDVVLTSDNENFIVEPDTIAASDLADGQSVDVTVKFAPKTEGEFTATINIASEGAESKTIALDGAATYIIVAPVASRLVRTGPDFFTASWTPCIGATSYTLRVTPKETVAQLFFPTTILTEDFGGCTKAITDFSTLDNYTDNPGWLDTRIYIENGGLRIGSKNAGTLTSPALDLSDSNGKVSVKFKAKAYNNDTNCQLTVGCGDATQTVDIPSAETEFTTILDCEAAANQTITFKNVGQNRRVVLTHVEIVSGDINSPVSQQSEERIITGITGRSYKVSGLKNNSTYYYDVKAIYGSHESDWSNRVTVRTFRHLQRLDDIIKNGITGDGFKFKDSLIIVHVFPPLGRAWCKDTGNSSVSATTKKDSQIDYMRDVTLEQTAEWDQSNWIMLQFPVGEDNGIEEMLRGAEGKIIAPETLSAYYIDDVNYTFEVLPGENGYELTLLDDANYEKNHYCTANFMEANLNIDGGKGALDSSTGRDIYYFFMNPKIQEVCEITHAKFDKNGTYMIPDNSMFKGGFKVDWSYNADGPLTPEQGKVYSFTAVVNRMPASTGEQPKAAAPQRSAMSYIVYPLDLTSHSGVTTSINDMDDNREVTGIDYVNVAGQVSDKPFEGVNIVITRYSDGSSTATKRLIKYNWVTL